MKTIRAVAIDAAFAHMGLAAALITLEGSTIKVEGVDLRLISTEREGKKVVRKSSDDLRRAGMLHQGLCTFIKHHPGTTIAFAEVPSGSQSASAARALGIAVGVLGGCPLPIVEVSPMEVKRLFSKDGKRKVPKTEIIAWAMKQWPKLPWLRHAGKVTLANEHLADAMAVIMAGVETNEFKQLLAIHHEVPSTSLQRPAAGRRALY